MIRIVLFFVKSDMSVEMIVEGKANMKQLIKEIRKMCDIHVEETYFIFEKSTGTCCDHDVSLTAMGVRSGMHFLIF